MPRQAATAAEQHHPRRALKEVARLDRRHIGAQQEHASPDAIAIGNDTVYGLGAGVWSRNINNCYRVGRAIKAGRCWTNCYHVYPAGAAFGGYKESGFGRETHKQMLEHYQQTKNVLVSYSTKAMGFF